VGSRLARLASNLWKGMSKESKEKYEQGAKVERDRYHQEMIQYKIDYPNEIESRRKKISNSMKRALRDNNELQKG
jgi:Flp pilus assembly protein TadB